MDSRDKTWWFCSECDFKIEEDESKECRCGKCKSPLPSVSWLIDKHQGFYWCFSCNEKTDQITNERPTDEDWLNELNKMSS